MPFWNFIKRETFGKLHFLFLKYIFIFEFNFFIEKFIFRSDSNTEDLEGFSGAGLFDSVPMICDNEVEMSYGNDKLFNDKKFVENVINKISSLGIGVEKLFDGVPQDIEGVYYNGDFYIVQTRPQV